MPCVKDAEKKIASSSLDHEYLPIGGNSKFCQAAAELAFGYDSPIVKDKINVDYLVHAIHQVTK